MNSPKKTRIISTIILLTLASFFPNDVSAQRSSRSEGIFQLRVENNMTKEEAYRKAIDMAKINAIEKAYGTYVEQQTHLTVDSGTSDFYIIGNTKVKGIWVRDIDRPEFDEEYREEKGQYGTEKVLWITCRIKGEVKPVKPRPAIEYQVRNCNLPACRTTSFHSGEHLYLWFKSPVKGYLSVFLDDGKMVYRLLPYSHLSEESAYEIKADDEYLLFSEGDKNELFTDNKSEFNTLILVFSTERYFKPAMNHETTDKEGNKLPQSITRTRLGNWLSEQRAHLDDFIDISIPIEIKKL